MVDLPLAEAVELLAKRAADRRTRPPTYLEKVALEASNVLSAVGDYVRNNDTARGALLGSGAGALAGAGSALLGPGSWREKRRRLGSGLLTGGLAGAALGGGVGAARQFGRGLGPPTAGPSGEAGAGGEFTHPDTGQKVKIDPGVLRRNPGLAARVQQLQTPGVEERISRGVGAGLGAAATYAPASSLTGLGIAAQTGANALRGAGRRATLDNLRAGLAAKDVGKSLRGGQETLDAIRGMGESEQKALLGRVRGPGLLGRLLGRRADPTAAVVPEVGAVGDRAVGSLRRIGRDEVGHILDTGHAARRVAGGKIPPVVGRNAALMTGAGLVDLGRHLYLGSQEEAAKRQELRELMNQSVLATTSRGR